MDQNNKNSIERKDNSKDAVSKLIRIASVLIAIAIVGICFAYTKLDGTGIGQIAMYVISALLALFGAFIIFIMAYGTHLDKHRSNLFLYDKKIKKEIPVSELTVERIRERLVMQMSLFKRGGKLYVGGQALSDLWIFIVGPFVGAALAAGVWKILACNCDKKC